MYIYLNSTLWPTPILWLFSEVYLNKKIQKLSLFNALQNKKTANKKYKFKIKKLANKKINLDHFWKPN